MNVQLLGGKKTHIILGIAIPIIFWSLSEILPWMASGINRIGSRYTQTSSNSSSGRLTITGKNSTERKYINDLKFPLSGKLDPRFAHDRFQLQMTGLLEVEKPGIYWIGTDSDDGSRIWIDGKKILDNGGLHPRQEKINFVHLQKGIHFIELKFENLMGEAYLEVFWVLPDGIRKPLSFRSFPFDWFIPYLFEAGYIFFKIAQYWVFFLVPFLLYHRLFPFKPKEVNHDWSG